MNPTEQRARFTRGQELDQRIDDLVVVTEALDAGLVLHAQTIAAHREELDQADRTLDAMIRGLRDRTLLGRLRWLVTGR